MTLGIVTTRHDLFPVLVHVSDFEPDLPFNAQLVEFARQNPKHNNSTSGCNLLDEPGPWANKVREIFATGLAIYLGEADPENACGRDVLMHVFFNHTQTNSFTPVHNHLYDGHLVGIYYAMAPERASEGAEADDYYALPPGTLVLCSHIPDGGDFDRRGPHSRSFFTVPAKANRLIVHPGTLSHFVTPSGNEERLAVTCNYFLKRDDYYRNYRPVSL